jgi:acylphosphatase
MRRVHVIVRGVVQGVGFRWATRRQATGLGLGGSVRNRADGTVEIVAEGPPDAVDRLLAWARRGPPGAVVENVQVNEGEATGEYDGFGIRH